MNFDAIIIGGGAAGLFCAITAGKRGRRVLVIEHNAEVGRKIVISGGGRCNFTNRGTTAENYVSANTHFCKSALAGYSPADFVQLVRRYGIEHYEKKLGQLFCRGSSRQIVEMLLAECRQARVTIRTGCTVSSVAKNDDYEIETNQGRFTTKNLVIACGGLSFAKIGATDLGYRIARQFGLKLVETRPSLVGLVSAKGKSGSLAGTSIDSVVAASDHSFRENILFTHRGLSGPAILQISNYWRCGESINVDTMPDSDLAAMLRDDRSGKKLSNFLSGLAPQKFVTAVLPAKLAERRLGDLSNSEIETVAEIFHALQMKFVDTEGYDRAEVTLGGVSTGELSSKTMESRRIPGLFFIGEVVDVTGWLGGYNFQWAWASGFAAGNSV